MAFHGPFALGIGVREFGHVHVSPVHQRAMIGNADHAAPRALANQHAQLRGAEHPRENVPVGSRVAVEQDRLRTDEHALGVHAWRRPIAGVIESQHDAAQPLDDHARNVAAAVGAIVDQERFLAQLRVIPLDEFADARLAHVGQVHVADPAVREFIHFAAVLFHPVEVDQIGLAGQRAVGDLARSGQRGRGVQRQLDRRVAGVAQVLVDVLLRRHVLAIDRQHIVAYSRVHAHLGQRGTIDLFLVLPLEDLRDAVAAGSGVDFKPHARQTGVWAWRQRYVAAVDIGVLHGQFRDHFAEHVIQVGTVRHIRQQLAVALADGLPIVPMHVRRVEEITVPSPHLVEDLFPFLGRHPLQLQAVGRYRSLGARARRCRVVDIPRRTLAHQHFRSVPRQHKPANVVDQLGVLPVFEREDVQRRLRFRRAAIVRRRPSSIDKRVGLYPQAEVVVGFDGHARRPACQAVEVDAFILVGVLCRCILGLGRQLVLILILRGIGLRGLVLLNRDFVAFQRERVLDVLAQRQRKDASRTVRGEIELDLRKLRMKLVHGDVVQIIALGIPLR